MHLMHMHPICAAGAGALTTVLLATGCDGAPADSASGEKAFSAVGFTFGARGDIAIHGASRAAVTPAGTYPVTAGRAYRFVRPGDRLLVVLRHWPESRTKRASLERPTRQLPPEEQPVETGFLVDTASWVRAGLDGHHLQWLRRDTIRVDATSTAAGDLTRLTLSGPHGGGPGQRVPPPTTHACTHLDPDTPRRATLPDIERGTDVTSALTRLRALCLNIQYATTPGTTHPGTVHQILLPLADQHTPSIAIPTDHTTPLPNAQPLLDPSRPATLILTR